MTDYSEMLEQAEKMSTLHEIVVQCQFSDKSTEDREMGTTTFRCDKEVLLTAHALLDRHGISMSEFLRGVVERYVEEYSPIDS
jgi:predicted HicB family RNase H-like nuclease